MDKPPLGRLTQVDLREYWVREDTEFTPWLGRAENLELLGDALGRDLERHGEEVDVGPFRADLLCTDAATGDRVLVENQIERTDHTHLGQILTYAAGLGAKTIVWIARTFQEEHRAALDWLNEHTSDEIEFFGVQVELWRIGDSPPAPRFDVVARPNDWSRTVRKSAAARGLSESDFLHKEFWTAFNEYLAASGSKLKPRAPSRTHWTNWGIGRSSFALHAVVGFRDGWVWAAVIVQPPDSEAHFRLLERQRGEIERELGATLKWDFKEGRAQNYVALLREDVDPMDRKTWPELHRWLAEKLEAIERCMRPRIARLDASEWRPDGTA